MKKCFLPLCGSAATGLLTSTDKYNMNQYQHTPLAQRPLPIKEEKISYAEQQLMETVRRLALLTDQQGRQIRRLETQLEILREAMVQRGRP